jgi:hypothetical protein
MTTFQLQQSVSSSPIHEAISSNSAFRKTRNQRCTFLGQCHVGHGLRPRTGYTCPVENPTTCPNSVLRGSSKSSYLNLLSLWK